MSKRRISDVDPDDDYFRTSEDDIALEKRARYDSDEEDNADDADDTEEADADSEGENTQEIQKLLNAVSKCDLLEIETLKHLSLEQFQALFQKQVELWRTKKPNSEEKFGFEDIIELGKTNFGIGDEIMHREDIARGFKRSLMYNLSLVRYITTHALEDEVYAEYELSYGVIANKISEVIFNTYKALNHLYSSMKSFDPQYDFLSMNDDHDIFRFAPVHDQDKLTDFQKLALYIENCLVEDDLRKYGDFTYSKHYNSSGVFTYYWKQDMKITDYIYRKTRKDTGMMQWYWRTKSPNAVKNLAEMLKDGQETEFPPLERNEATLGA